MQIHHGTVVLYTNQTDFKQEHLCKQDCEM